MRLLLKKIFIRLPVSLKRTLVLLREAYFRYICLIKEREEYVIQNNTSKIRHSKKRLLLYHISGLSFGGTEKNLQSIANNLCDEYEVFFLYSNKDVKNDRLDYVDKKVHCIKFNYTEKSSKYPFYIKGMMPHIKNIIHKNEIDLLITADSGYTQYPINTITNIPIIMINIFGSPTLQKNIVSNVFISKEVQRHSEKYTGARKGNLSLFIPILILSDHNNGKKKAEEIRNNFGISNDDFVFGRIGRNENSIFDPIGIRAFQKVVRDIPHAHYIIMSPPPILEKIVADENVPNVHFLPPSSNEVDIWGFHYAIDSLAHFRHDGETFGLNIAESMYAGNPIISHRSRIWNAHAEYLDISFSRIADIDDTTMYAEYMREFILLKKETPEKWLRMREKAHHFAEEHFSEKKYKESIKKLITNL